MTTRQQTLELARDPGSELYHKGIPRRGASHRCAFWDGYLGRKSPGVPRNSIGYQCFLAGKDFAKECDLKAEFDWRGYPTKNCDDFRQLVDPERSRRIRQAEVPQWLVTVCYPNAAHNRTETFAYEIEREQAEGEAYGFYNSFVEKPPEDVIAVFLTLLDGHTAQVLESEKFTR